MRILLFAGVREKANRSEIDIDVSGDATAETILAALESALPESAEVIRISRLAVDGKYVRRQETVQQSAEEVALIPPVSGG